MRPVRITEEVFAELFGVRLPTGVLSAWVRGVRYIVVDGSAEIEKLERLIGGMTSGKA
jgi:outer membrane biogenesis lipoprotein LolB